MKVVIFRWGVIMYSTFTASISAMYSRDALTLRRMLQLFITGRTRIDEFITRDEWINYRKED